MNDLKFYEIADDYRAILTAIEEAGGELSPELEVQLDLVGEALTDKADAIAGLIRSQLATAAAFKEEANRLADHARTAANTADSLKAYLKRCLKAAGLPRLDTRRFTVRIQGNSAPTIRWTGMTDDIPIRLSRIVVELDGKAAAAELKAKGKLPDGFSYEIGDHLRIA